MKAEFECMEAYLKELDALKNYDEVKKLSEEIPNLKAKLSEVEAERDRLKEGLTKKQEIEDKAHRLEETLKQTQKELAALKEVRAAFQGGDVTLKDAMRRLIKARDDEVNVRAAGKFEELKKDFGSRMPALIYDRLITVLKGPEWPADIAAVINKEADQKAHKKMNDEFQKRVNMAASEKIEMLKRTEWLTFLEQNVSRITSDIKSLVDELKGTYDITCDRCGTSITLNVGPQGIASLLAGELLAECPNCRDFGLPPLPPIISHRIPGSNLEGIVLIYLARNGI